MTHRILPIDYWQALVYAPVTALIGMAVAWHENPAVAPELLSLAALQASVVMVLQVWLASRPWAMLAWFDRSPVLIRMALLTGYGAALVNLTVLLIGQRLETSGLSVGLVAGLALACYDQWRLWPSPTERQVQTMMAGLYMACVVLPFCGLMQWVPTAAVWACAAAIPAWKAGQLAHLQTHQPHVQAAVKANDWIRLLLLAALVTLLTLLLFSLMVSTLFGQRTNV
ncbi:MAG: hypothetical protein ACO3QJ_01205 [Burkholderiaceae bacterium]